MTKVSLLTKEFLATANKSSRTGNMLLSVDGTRVTPNWLTNTVNIWQSCCSAIFLALILPSLNLLRMTACHIDILIFKSSGFSEDWIATFWKQYWHYTCARNIIITKSTDHKLCNFTKLGNLSMYWKHHAADMLWESVGAVPHILNVCRRWRWTVNFMVWSTYKVSKEECARLRESVP